jgi:hypothetical protein
MKNKLGLKEMLLAGALYLLPFFGIPVTAQEAVREPIVTKSLEIKDSGSVKEDSPIGREEKVVDVEGEIGTLTHIKQYHVPTNYGNAIEKIIHLRNLYFKGEKELSNEDSKKKLREAYLSKIQELKEYSEASFPEEILQVVEACQKEILSILQNRMKGSLEARLYREGESAGDVFDGKKSRNLIRNLNNILQETGFSEEESIRRSLAQMGSTSIYAFLNNSQVYGCEPENHSELQKNNGEERENGVIKYILSKGTRDIFLVYGGDHDFENNVREWNKNNPNQQYDLVVISPSTLHKYSKDNDEKKNKTTF